MGNELESGKAVEQQEQEKESKVILYLCRHAEAFRDPNLKNIDFPLSEGPEGGLEQGRIKSKGIEAKRNPKQSAAVGSPRMRALVTAAMLMARPEEIDRITGKESPEELKLIFDGEESKPCSRIKINPRLDFYMDKESPFGKKALEARNEHHTYLKFIVEDSDDLAIDLKDPNASTYSRQAADVAKVVRNYAAIAHQWDKIAKSGRYTDQDGEIDPVLERFLGSHGGVIESFLLKVIEKKRGVAERDRLVGLIGNQFANTEGIEIEITGQGKDQKMHISYSRTNGDAPDQNFVFDEIIPLKDNILDEIIDEGEIFISKKFQEWTKDLEPREARISIFKHIRDIPYAVVGGRDPKKAPEELLMDNKGSCTAKHVVLSQMLHKLGIETQYVSHIFKWSDLPAECPEELKELALQMPQCDHLLCQASIDGKWVDVDATWDLPLAKAGFPAIEKWDGVSATPTAVKVIKEIIHSNLVERTRLKKEMVGEYTDAEEAAQKPFYDKFNAWLDSLR